MRLIFAILFSFLGLVQNTMAQDTIVLDGSKNFLNHSIADYFTLYESSTKIDLDKFLEEKGRELKGKKILNPIENIDFTSKTYFLHFIVDNQEDSDRTLYLETGRPITNEVTLYDLKSDQTHYSGDGIPFNSKTIASNSSVLPLYLKANSKSEYVLSLTSDGEVILLPMIFWEQNRFEQVDRSSQFIMGIFYGIFIFVIIIYFTFYLLLKDRLFLIYTIYVVMSGLMQFALDGYLHQYIFKSGGYLTQHSVILTAGLTVLFALQYAKGYLELKGRLKKATSIISLLVILTLFLSLVPGKIYETCFPLINIFSLLSILFLIFVALRIRKQNKSISRLFLVGLVSLLIGGVLFVLGNLSVIELPTITQNGLKSGTLIEILCLSILMAGKYKSMQDEKEQAQKELLKELEDKQEKALLANIRLEQEVAERTKEINEQRVLLKEKNDDFVASITYAERIQSAILSNEKQFRSILPESVIIYRPKDIVSGDFFWIEENQPDSKWPNGLITYVTADCTGHGVPGAFVSIVCNNLLKIGKNKRNVQSPGQALDFVNKEINKTLNSQFNELQIRDGMDVSVCALDIKGKRLYFSGAKNGAYIVRKGEIIELKGDRRPIGYSDSGAEFSFNTQEVDLQTGDMIYTLSDGFVDQFGGPKQKKFMAKKLKDQLISICDQPVEKQQELLNIAFDEWKGDLDQVDDVLLLGVKIN